MGGLIGFIVYAVAALASGLAAVAVHRSAGAARPDRQAAIFSLALTAIWALSTAALGPGRPLVDLAEVGRNIAWIHLLYRMFANDGRDATMRSVRPVAIALCLVEGLQPVLIALGSSADATLAAETSALLRMLVGIGALVLLHNLVDGAAESSRRLMAWNAAGLAILWGCLLNFHAMAFLGGGAAPETIVLRGLLIAVAAPIFALGYARSSAELRFRPSRSVTFRLLSLGLIAAYLAALVLASKWFGGVAGDWPRVAQVGFLLAATGLSLLWLPSRRFRAWLRVVALKHLFRHRYDYREEWLRFTQTIGRASNAERPLTERAVQSLADIAGSDSGFLLVPEWDGSLVVGARWRWEDERIPGPAGSADFTRFLEREQLIVDLDEVRSGIEHRGELAFVPDWLIAGRRTWAVIPLLHRDRLVGVVVLGRPDIPRRLDWEDFDLLTIAGRQVASYLAEQAGQEALEEAARFDEFNRRMAFLMHDIKNLSSQMGLLLRNAERHADNPEFRKDMLVTLRNSSDKLNAMLARLGRYGRSRNEALEEFDLGTLAGELETRFANQHPVRLIVSGPCRVRGNREALDQALSHLLQNAIDASEPDAPIVIEILCDGVRGRIIIADRGPGMSAAFVRDELFRPFQSSKPGGFGIGACEARDLIRGMGGRLDVETHEGLGTRFVASLPSAEAARIIAGRRNRQPASRNEAA